MLRHVIKRDGKRVKFRANKIRLALSNANAEVPVLEQATEEDIDSIVKDITSIKQDCIHIEVIQDMVETGLMQRHKFELAKKYILYRYVRKLNRDLSEAELSILGVLNGTNMAVVDENSNKNSYINSTQRDLMAGEVSKTIARKLLLPDDIQQAIDNFELHWHDMDYTVQSMINCFSRDTYFITDRGTISFNDVSDGDIINVYTHDGSIQKATVHCYGKQMLNKVVLRRSTYSREELYVTGNHTWLLKDGTRTTNLKVGDRLLQTPIIDDFNIDSVLNDSRLALFWCLGFCLGDGSDYDNSKYGQGDNPGIRTRLCDNKIKYANIFTKAGFNVTHPNHESSDDLYVCLPKYSKRDILDNKEYWFLDLDEKKALFNGYLASDGEFRGKQYATGVSTISDEIRDFVILIGEACGYYIGTERIVTGSTNFTDNRTPMHHIQFSREQYSKQPWIVESIEPYKEDEVWCLEVENNHSFILSGGIVTGNCCLIHIKSILDYGTVMSDYLILSPKSFRTACSIVTQVVAIIASNQYGGQSIAIKHLGKYLAISRERFRIENQQRWDKVGIKYTNEQLEQVVEEQLKYELEQGVQTIQYQFQTLVTTNGQSPFVTLFMQLDEQDPYINETAMIIEEIIKQRIKGVMNKDGKYITPSFPKLIYVLDEHNCLRGGRFDYITKLAAKCTIKRSYPDYISAKMMREQFDGEVFSCMGCRSFLSSWRKTKWYVDMMNEPDSEIGKYLWEGRFNQGRQLCPLSA